ncbi:hypothetical protein L1049_020570 [Liquidambar formosana]|uniref:WAT1-related protein n=1 Tax=Liquidambar formosana TaxID=63359 RepID=A0AAP0S841_LIQFO
MAMGFFYYGLRDTTATYATNFLNLIPVVTFVFSTIAGMERLGVHTGMGKIKIAGAMLCLAGALTTSLYKGKAFHLGHRSTAQHHTKVKTTKPNLKRGSFFLSCSVLSYAAWFIVQVKLFKVFPSKYWATMLTCIIASIQSTVIGLCLDRRKSAWQLGWNLQLVTIMYSGTLATAASFCLISWAVANRGPAYPPMFNPVSLILVAILEALLFGGEIRLGSLVGMAMIIVGLYSFLWGRKNESRSLPPPNVAGEVTTVVPESTGLQTTASVMPTNSHSDSVIHVEEVVGKNQSDEALQA